MSPCGPSILLKPKETCLYPPNAGIFQESSFLGTQTFETSEVGGDERGQDGTHHESLFVPDSNCLSGTPEQVEPVRSGFQGNREMTATNSERLRSET